jgi:hypothetical protein
MHWSNLELKELTVSYNTIGVNVSWDLEKYVKFADLEYFWHEFAPCVPLSPSGGTGKKEANGYALKAGFNWYTLYGGVEGCLTEGFHINSVGYLSTSSQTAGFVVRSKGTPSMSSTENNDTREVIGSRFRQICINTDSISRMMQHCWTEFIIQQDTCFFVYLATFVIREEEYKALAGELNHAL